MTGLSYLQRKLSTKRIRVLLRYKYYEGKNCSMSGSEIIHPQLQQAFNSTLGWCAKGVDALSDRLTFREFDNDNFNINQIYQMNNPDVLFRSAIHEALIGACSFIYISADENGEPRLQVIDASNATGIIDPITGLLKEGYVVLERDEFHNPVTEAYFLPYVTWIVSQDGTKAYRHNVAYPLLVPIINRPDAKRNFGHSQISRACMNIVDKARYTITRADVSAEFYSFPQKYAVGTDPDAEPLDKWKAAISSMIEFTKDADGDKPTLGQFQQQSMTPHLEQLKAYASLFAGETGLTLDDLGFATENPSSADAIKSQHENLRLAAKAAQKTFGSGLLNAGFLAACLRDDYPYERKQFYLTTPKWEPIFEPDASAMSVIGDGLIKVNQAIPNYIDEAKAKDLLNI